jgi:hypothetical protein
VGCRFVQEFLGRAETRRHVKGPTPLRWGAPDQKTALYGLEGFLRAGARVFGKPVRVSVGLLSVVGLDQKLYNGLIGTVPGPPIRCRFYGEPTPAVGSGKLCHRFCSLERAGRPFLEYSNNS